VPYPDVARWVQHSQGELWKTQARPLTGLQEMQPRSNEAIAYLFSFSNTSNTATLTAVFTSIFANVLTVAIRTVSNIYRSLDFLQLNRTEDTKIKHSLK
jgi:hypothetical protein